MKLQDTGKSFSNLPEPSKHYLMKERSESERRQLLEHMQEMMSHRTVHGPLAGAGAGLSRENSARGSFAPESMARKMSEGTSHEKRFKLMRGSVHI